jgi:hydrogenase nickel incorporation protein HypA/HybF
MHELGIARSIVAIVDEHARGRKVRRVTLQIGALSAILPDAVSFCFDVVAAGTAVEGAKLDIDRIAGRGRCRTCGAQFPTPDLVTPCACGSRDIERLAGDELKIKSMELEEAA